MRDDVDISTLIIEQFLALIRDKIRPSVVKPKIGNDIEFKINSNFMRELRRKLFAGIDDDDAYEHVRRVLEIVDLFHFPSVTHDAIMLRDLLEKAFIRQYCPPFKTAKRLEEICNFKQEMYETLTHEAVYSIRIPKEIHKMKSQEDDGDINDGRDITSKDVERLRQILTPTIHTLPNLEPMVQLYMPLGPVHDMKKVEREEEQDYDIPLHDGVMQPLTT
ncbi:hypothetical protein Tco_1159708, partial [Tanacetum coccineum]